MIVEARKNFAFAKAQNEIERLLMANVPPVNISHSENTLPTFPPLAGSSSSSLPSSATIPPSSVLLPIDGTLLIQAENEYLLMDSSGNFFTPTGNTLFVMKNLVNYRWLEFEDKVRSFKSKAAKFAKVLFSEGDKTIGQAFSSLFLILCRLQRKNKDEILEWMENFIWSSTHRKLGDTLRESGIGFPPRTLDELNEYQHPKVNRSFRVDVCPRGCMAFFATEEESLEECPHCKHPRSRPCTNANCKRKKKCNHSPKDRIPYKSTYYHSVILKISFDIYLTRLPHLLTKLTPDSLNEDFFGPQFLHDITAASVAIEAMNEMYQGYLSYKAR